MTPLRLKELKIVVANGLAEKHSDEQFLPEELEDALLALINSVGLSALSEAIRISQDRIAAGASPDELQSTESLETSSGFATEHFSRATITHFIADMSGLEIERATTVLGLVEQAVNRSVFGSEAKAPTEVEFEGIGVISPGQNEGAYHIDLAETLRVPPLRHVSILSSLFNAAGATSRASAAS